jgi:alpha-L-rhamnosidase
MVDVSWKIEGGKFTLDVTIPAGTTALITMPGKAAQAGVGHEGLAPNASKLHDGHPVFEVGSGSYNFTSSLQNP